MKRLILAVSALCCIPVSFAQLTTAQKLADFQTLAGSYDKKYGPYEWKKRAFGFDALNLDSWLDQVRRSPDDLSFYDISVRYVASLRDSHDEFTVPSEYDVYLPFTADIYDGKVLIDFVDHRTLDPSVYTFEVGDELVSVNGVDVAAWIKALAPYSVNGSGNPVSRDRLAVGTLLERFQSWYPFAPRVKAGDQASIAVKSRRTGQLATFSVTWVDAAPVFLPLIAEGPVSSPDGLGLRHFEGHRNHSLPMKAAEQERVNAWRAFSGITAPWLRTKFGAKAAPSNMTPAAARHARHRQAGPLYPEHVLAGGLFPFESPFPAFNPPPGFQIRLGVNPDDEFLTGTFPVGTHRVGFIRIPNFDPGSQPNALRQFQEEITYFQQNTDGLVIDIMSNGGGDLCYTDTLTQFLIPTPFRALQLRVRATEEWALDFEQSVYDLQASGAPDSVVNAAISQLQRVLVALHQNRGFSEPVDVCDVTPVRQPARDQSGNNLAYTKPLVVLTNNFTLSAAEVFAATLQDAQRATLFGTTTDGGGGNVVQTAAGPYSEGQTRVTESLLIRNRNVSAPGLPPAPYIENIGVIPDVLGDYQTRDNLLNGGAGFVQGFSSLILDRINGR